MKESMKVQESIDLVRASRKDAKLLHSMQQKAFMPLYEKYHDDETNPAKESLERITEKTEESTSEFYIIRFMGEAVGGIRIQHRESKDVRGRVLRISPIFIIPEFQNKGIAQAVIKKVFELYQDAVIWKLDTIEQEPGNCHLYEKCGFIKTGGRHFINENMTLINYEKRV